jgi:hypothetical protein
MTIRAEDPETPEDVASADDTGEPQSPAHPEPEAADDEPIEDEPKEDAKKFCAYCGSKMGKVEAEADDKEDDDEDDDAPTPEQNSRASNAVASIFGLRANASIPAVKSAAIALAELGRAVMVATGTNTPRAALGAFQTIVDDAAQTAKYKAENKQIKQRENGTKRVALLQKLASLNLKGFSRGDLFTDYEGPDGKLHSKPAALYAKTDLETLEGFVNGKCKSASPSTSNPFEPSAEKAKAATVNSTVENLVENSPIVKIAAGRSTATPEQLAKTEADMRAAGMIK